MVKNILVSAIFGGLVLSAAYQQRGYFAAGAEWMLPIILLMLLVKEEG